MTQPDATGGPPRRHWPPGTLPYAGQVVRRVLLRRNIVIHAETAQLVAAAVQAVLQAVSPPGGRAGSPPGGRAGDRDWRPPRAAVLTKGIVTPGNGMTTVIRFSRGCDHPRGDQADNGSCPDPWNSSITPRIWKTTRPARWSLADR